ncbi:hypothetical protein QOZ80_5BG0423440 [Eleusine coracana subsp. coracana]|nr:hypothetical protein QOZ80_5BG0423440 [Eleusine coracana subsp. coracana]
MSEGRTSPAPASLPGSDDMLGEILLRLPPLPSALPRASLVCKRWRRLVSDPHFIRRFRARHRTPPLLGFFYHRTVTAFVFVPTLDPPDRIPPACFSLPQHTESRRFLGCRHGLAAYLNLDRTEVVAWEPVTGSRCFIPFPPGLEFDDQYYIFNGEMLSATNDYGDGYVDNDPHFRPFKFVMLFNNGEENLVSASVFESESGEWGNMSSIAIPANSYLFDPGVLVGNALFWFDGWGGDILEFDLDNQSHNSEANVCLLYSPVMV